MKPGDHITTPDGYRARVLLCNGRFFTVYLLYAHVANKYRTYKKVTA